MANKACILKSNNNKNIDNSLINHKEPLSYLIPKDIYKKNELCLKDRGLRVLVVRDSNDKDLAKDSKGKYLPENEYTKIANDLKKLGWRNKVLAVIGHYSSDITGIVLKKYNDNKLVLISSGSTSEDFTDEGKDYFFRTVPSTSNYADMIVKFMQHTKIKNPAIFYLTGSPFSISIYDEIVKSNSKSYKAFNDFKKDDNRIFNDNNQVPDVYRFDQNSFDAKSVADRLTNTTVDSMIVIPDGEVTASQKNAIKIIKQFGGDKWILGTWTLYKHKIFQDVKSLMDKKKIDKSKVVFYSPWYYNLSGTSQEFTNQVEKLWGETKHPVNALSFDAASVAYQALNSLKKPNPTSEDLQIYLSANPTDKKYIGATSSEIKFHETGNRTNLQGTMLEVVRDSTNGKVYRLEPVGK